MAEGHAEGAPGTESAPPRAVKQVQAVHDPVKQVLRKGRKALGVDMLGLKTLRQLFLLLVGPCHQPFRASAGLRLLQKALRQDLELLGATAEWVSRGLAAAV